MYVRTTQQLIVNSAIEYARRHSTRLADLQQQISTGIRLHRPSDDPAAYRSAVTQQFTDQRFTSHMENIDVARSRLDTSVSQLLAAKDLFLEARDIAFESRQTNERGVFVSQVDRLLGRLQKLANERFDGNFLFSGTATTTQPFEFPETDARGRGVYLGSGEHSQITIGLELTADVFSPGAEVFQPERRGTSVYLGNTGAAAGLGTDSGVGFGVLSVRHVATTYGGSSGITAGTTSPNDDTIIGPTGANNLTIDDVAKTISLNGGPAVSYAGTETNLRVGGPTGELVHVDVTGVVAGFQGSVAVTATGTLSTDGGATQVAIDFSANQAVTNSATGEITFVNSVDIDRTGEARVEYTGTSDAFGVLFELRRELLNVDGLSEAEWQQAMTRRITDLDRVKDHLLDVVGQHSATLGNLESVRAHHEDLQLETRRVLSDLMSADLPSVITELQSRQTLLQTTYATTLTLMNTSLIEFLQ